MKRYYSYVRTITKFPSGSSSSSSSTSVAALVAKGLVRVDHVLVPLSVVHLVQSPEKYSCASHVDFLLIFGSKDKITCTALYCQDEAVKIVTRRE